MFSGDLRKLYDKWEFWEVQDDEITKAEDKLRSTRSKLAVLEGKMALAIMCVQILIIKFYVIKTNTYESKLTS